MAFTRIRLRKALLCGLSVIALAPVLYAGSVEEIKALLDHGNAAAAYRFGKSHPDEMGNPSFDFYFGIAAIDSGHSGEGVLALERYTLNFPDNLSARLELARGYFVLADDQRAREEFYAVLETNPPAPVKANINKFLDAMNSRESQYRTTANGIVETGFGYDTNAIGGIGSPNVNLPGFGEVTVSEEGLRAPTMYEMLSAGGQVARPLAPGLTLFARGRIDGRFHNAAQQFNQNNAAATSGLSYIKNKNAYSTAISYSKMDVDKNRFRSVGDVSVEWHRLLNELKSVDVQFQYAQLRYAGSNEARNANFNAVGVGFRRAFIRDWRPQLTANAHAGAEHNIEDRPDLGRYLLGGDAGLVIAPASKWTLSAAATYLWSQYNAEDDLTSIRRQDHYYGLSAAATYALKRQVIVGAELLGARNGSNLALYEYERGLLTFRIRYEFH
jgi:hypothetical protein